MGWDTSRNITSSRTRKSLLTAWAGIAPAGNTKARARTVRKEKVKEKTVVAKARERVKENAEGLQQERVNMVIGVDMSM
jgi:gas vesicle protein